MYGKTEKEFLKMDIRKYNCMLEASIRRRELDMQDMALVGHCVAGKISEAVWGEAQKFNKPIDISLKPKSVYQKLADSCNEMRLKKDDVLKRLRKNLAKQQEDSRKELK